MGCPRYVDFPPNSDRRTDIAGCLKGATFGLRRARAEDVVSADDRDWNFVVMLGEHFV